MDNPRISEDTREKIEEAAVAVFMDQYAAALDAAIDVKMEDCVDMEFPAELDKRCRALIQQEYAQKRKKEHRKSALRVLRSAAVVAVALLSLCSVLFMTVEAFRLPIMTFFIEKTDRYWQLSGQQNTSTIQEAFNPENPLDGIIPDDYLLANLDGSWDNECLAAEYSNGDRSTICFVILPSSGNTQIDTENADAVPHKVLGYDALKSIEGNRVRITWLDEENSRVLTLDTTNIAVEMVEIYAEAIAVQLD